MFEHKVALERLSDHQPLKEKLVTAQRLVAGYMPFIARVAVTFYDPDTRVLASYLDSGGSGAKSDPPPLNDNASLRELLEKRRPRVIDHRLTFEHACREPARRIGRSGYAATYTLPLFHNGRFFGFVFFNADRADVFTEAALRELDLFGHLIGLLVIHELNALNLFPAAANPPTRTTHVRDPQTGTHRDRLSRYCRLIARTLAERHRLTEDYVEQLFMFAPLHDIGKLSIPHSILLKPGKLNPQETATMRTHPRRGREIIDDLIRGFGFDDALNVDILRNIAEYHHEAMDGSGYPEGKRGTEVPLEARIVAVADVFDALTSRRPYKEGWSNKQAFATLDRLAGNQLDGECVAALMAQYKQVAAIQQRFAEDPCG